MTGMFGILCCENLAGELAAVVAAGEFPGVLTRTFHIGCGGKRVRWGDGIEAPFLDMRETCDRICILGCGAGIEPPALPGPAPVVVTPDLMQGVLLPEPLFDACVREGALMVIPGILSRWKEHVAALGFAEEVPTEFFRESVKKIVLIDTGVDPESPRTLAKLGEELRIPTSGFLSALSRSAGISASSISSGVWMPRKRLSGNPSLRRTGDPQITR